MPIGCPQLADLGSVHAGATADLQAVALALTEDVTQETAEVDRVAVAGPSSGAVPAKKLLFVPIRDLVVRRSRRHLLLPFHGQSPRKGLPDGLAARP